LSWDSISNEGGVTLKNGKKPEALLKRIIELGTDGPEDIVLDFHVGSGTTCAVAHKMGRRYIGIEQIDYGENDSLARLKNVIAGDSTGISKSVKWTGGGTFVFAEIAEYNQKFIPLIAKAKEKKDLVKIWEEIKSNGFLSYQLNFNEFEKNIHEFDELSIKNQKEFLLEVLDKNMLYIPFTEMEDETYKLAKSTLKANRSFYGDI
jgi:adenine-specific DNA-methyltransferase